MKPTRRYNSGRVQSSRRPSTPCTQRHAIIGVKPLSCGGAAFVTRLLQVGRVVELIASLTGLLESNPCRVGVNGL
jgi:hypothetical protein